MNADANHGCHERIMLLCVYEHAVQAVIIEDAVVDTLRGGALFIDFLISIRAVRDVSVKPDIPLRPCLDDPSVSGTRAVVLAFGTVFLPIGTAPHEVTAGLVITIGLHAQFFLAQWGSVFVNSDGIRDCLWLAAFVVEVDECPYLPFFRRR